MGSKRAVVIECDQSTEMLVVKNGDVVGKYSRGHDRRFTFDGSPVTNAWQFAATLGWRSFTKRNADGSFREVRARPYSEDYLPGRRLRWTPGEWVVAPGVEPDPPYSVAAITELERIERDRRYLAEWHEEKGCSIAEQVARLQVEIDRLQGLSTH